MTDKELSVLSSIVLTLKHDPILLAKSDEEVMRWVSRQLYGALKIYASPIGSVYLFPTWEEAYKRWVEAAPEEPKKKRGLFRW